MWPNLSQYVYLMSRPVAVPTTAVGVGNTFNVTAGGTTAAVAHKPHGVRVRAPGGPVATSEFDTLAQAREFERKVRADHGDWFVEVITYSQ